MDRRWIFAGALLGGCSDRPVMDPSVTGSSEGSGGSSTAVEPGMPTTSGSSEVGSSEMEETSDVVETSTGSSSSALMSTSESGSSSTMAATTGEPVTCGPPCDAGWAIEGDLTLPGGGDADEYACLTRVSGTLTIPDGIDAAGLAGLRNVREVGRLQIDFNNVLTDLSPLECLEVVHETLSLYQMEKLVDASALAGVRVAPYVSFWQTGLTALPKFSPEFEGVYSLYVGGNAALVDVDAVADWPVVGDASLTVQLDDNASLTSIVGLSGLIAGTKGAAVQITKSPQLQSLAGLESMTDGTLWLDDLPLVTDLEPLAGLVEADGVTLVGLPKVTSLHGLHNLGHADSIVLGNCVSEQMPGMDGLEDLSGLDALVSVFDLAIANNDNLTGLGGAPLLKEVQLLNVAGNPMLMQDDFDALLGQLDAAPGLQCFGGWDECMCYELMPW